jgi:glycine cleavage system transcriptional repressor
MQYVTITAVGRDRPGIVAEFSGTLYRSGCNLAETTMTRLGGEFAMILLVGVPEAEALAMETALQLTAGRLGLSLVIRPLGPVDLASEEPRGEGYILRVYGADRPGIVHAVTALLAERTLNITDLNTRVIPGSGGPVYVMLLELDVPSTEAAEALRPELDGLSRQLSVDITFSRLEQETL